MPNFKENSCPHCSVSPDVSAITIRPQPFTSTGRLASSNDPPLSSDIKVFKASFAQTTARLKFVTDNIAKLEGNIRVFSEERNRLNELAEAYQRILHPLRRLPEVVLREIIRASAHSGPLSMETNFAGPTHPVYATPWKLGQVCHTWRQVALSDHSLWSFVYVRFPDPPISKKAVAGMIAQLMCQLRRSGSSPLEVSLYSTRLLDDCDDALLTTICSHSSRWATLQATLSPQNLRILDHLIGGGIPNLRRLHLPQITTIEEIATIGTFSIAPRLCDVTFDLYSQSGLDCLLIPWSQITHFRILTTAKFATIANYSYLQKMPNLESFYTVVGGLAANTPEVDLLSLKALAICVQGRSKVVEPFLKRIHTPILRDLRIDATAADSSQITIPPSIGPTLRTLCLGVRTWTTADARRIFTSLSGLEFLSLYNASSEVLFELSNRDPSTGQLRLLPRLRDLGIFAYSPRPSDIPPLLRLLESRFSNARGSTYRLRKVRVHHKIVSVKDALFQLKRMASEGLDVDISPVDWVQMFPGF
ncbi:hypothetical protein PM082_004809 [Marasmius tenuissimus]|nr:hypothetical protein PM082_004809 [Marasmius tenuissimus]